MDNKAMSNRFIGILSGGSGTRLWPASRKYFAKQFIDLNQQGKPLFIQSILRSEKLGESSVIGTKSMETISLGLLSRFGAKNCSYLGEPIGKNTAPAIALFTHLCLKKNPHACIAIFPSDHHVENEAAFHTDLEKAFQLAEKGNICTIGIPPKEASTAYGYLETHELDENNTTSVKRFLEKPNKTKAQELIQKNNVFWNAGIFVFNGKSFLKEMQKHFPSIPELLEKLNEDQSNLEEIYQEMPEESIDYALMEKLDNLKCVAASFDWSDLGSWEQIAEIKNEEKNWIEINGAGNFFYSLPKTQKTIAFVGVENQIVVDTQDALLVTKKGAGQDIKTLVNQLKEIKPSITEKAPFEQRPWGRFEVLMDTEYFKSKRITVLPGKKLSYQSHKHRGEHWVIVKGSAEVVLNDKTHQLKAGEHIHIPLGAKHRICNSSEEEMEFIEVQIGSYFGEDDIIRYDDDFGRSS